MKKMMKTQLDTEIDPCPYHIGFRMPSDAGMGFLTLRGKNPSRSLPVLVACLVLFGMLHSSVASEGETEYRFMPYLWTAGLDAEMGPPGRTTSADVSFDDYVEMIDPSVAFAFEANGEKWSLLGDVMYVNLSENFNLPAGTLDYENTQLIFELAVGYKPEGWKETRIIGGARYIDMDSTIEFSTGPKVDVGQDWVDPFVGLEWRPRRGKWEYMIQGDIGGGVDADFTWGGMLGAAYHFNDRFAVEVGYRYMDIDFEDSEFVFDGHMEGIQIGLMMKFGKSNEK